jgi:multiple sugar transport system substrate-binding protein
VRPSWAVLPLAALAAGLVSSCAATTAPGEPVELRVVMADDWATAPVVREVIDDFERDHEQVRVQLQAAPFSQIPELVASGKALDQPYDVAHWHAFAAAAAGLAEPLDAQWEAAGLTEAEYLPGAVADVSWLGRRYGVPLDTNALVLLVNRGVLADVGLGPEDLRTMDGFRAAAAEVTAAGVVDHAMAVSASSWPAYGWIRAHGGELVRIDPVTGEPTFTFDDPGTIAALDLLVDLLRTSQAPPPFAQDLALDAVSSFAQGSIAMHASGSWDLPIIARAGGEDLDVAVLPLPQVDLARPMTVLGGSSLFVPQGSPHVELAFELMVRLTEDPVALRLAEEEGRLPARSRVFDEPLFTTDPLLAAFVAELPHAQVMTLIAYPEVSDVFREALEDTVTGRLEPAEAMAGVQRHAERWQDAQGR